MSEKNIHQSGLVKTPRENPLRKKSLFLIKLDLFFKRTKDPACEADIVLSPLFSRIQSLRSTINTP